jgi:hypothetical protein
MSDINDIAINFHTYLLWAVVGHDSCEWKKRSINFWLLSGFIAESGWLGKVFFI